jgi:hypothetical protein
LYDKKIIWPCDQRSRSRDIMSVIKLVDTLQICILCNVIQLLTFVEVNIMIYRYKHCVVCTILILFEGYMLQDMKCKTIWIPTLVISWKTLRPIILWNKAQQRYISLTKRMVADPWNNWILKYLNFNFRKYPDRLSVLKHIPFK